MDTLVTLRISWEFIEVLQKRLNSNLLRGLFLIKSAPEKLHLPDYILKATLANVAFKIHHLIVLFTRVIIAELQQNEALKKLGRLAQLARAQH